MKQNKLLSLLLCMLLAVSLLGTPVSGLAETATLEVQRQALSAVDGWYEIATAQELVTLSRSMAYFKDGTIPVDAKIRLMNDIDMAGVEGFLPIGDNSGDAGYFAGEFDGAGHVISNLKLVAADDWSSNLNDPEASLYMGFFGYIAGGHVHDLGLESIDFSTEGSNAGGIAGMMVAGTVERCFVTGTIKAGGSHVGSFNGRQRLGAKVLNNYAFVDLLGNDGVGGMVGTQLNKEPAEVLVENNLYVGNVEALGDAAGGIAGRIDPIKGNAFIGCVSFVDSVMSAGSAGAFSSSAPEDVTVENVVVAEDVKVGGTQVTALPDNVVQAKREDVGLADLYAGWDFENVWVMREANGVKWPALRAFDEAKQPVLPWLAPQAAGQEIQDGYAAPLGGGAAPHSVTYLWDSFNQPAGHFSARFNWVTSPAFTETVLYYAKLDDFLAMPRYTHKVTGTSQLVDLSGNTLYTGTDNISLAGVQSHKAQTDTLEPDTQYVFCVGNGGRNIAVGGFQTPPADLDTFDFIWITDSQTNDSSFETTLGAYEERAKVAYDMARKDFPNAAFVMHTGDAVNQTFDTWQWDAYFAANSTTFDRFPLYMIPGNHEYDGNQAYTGEDRTVDPGMSVIKGRFNAPQNGAGFYGGGQQGTEPLVSGAEKFELDGVNYYFVYGDTLFLMLTNVKNNQDIQKQAKWVKSVVRNNPTKWRVAALHISLFPGYRQQPDNYLEWTNAFDEAGIDVVLMGHDHIYLRTKLFADGQILEDGKSGEGTVYITNNPGTQRMGYIYSERPYTEVYSSEFGKSYAALSISPQDIRITAKGYADDTELTVVEDHTVIATQPRTPRLDAYMYPEAAEEQAVEISEAVIGGTAKERQQLLALTMPRGANADFQWQQSEDGQNWEDIQGADQRKLEVNADLVGKQLRVLVNGTGVFSGNLISEPTKAVEPMISDKPNEPGYTMNLADAQVGELPAEWASEGEGAASIDMVDDQKALRIVSKAPFSLTIPFGAQRQTFDISYDLYVNGNGIYPNLNDRYYTAKMALIDAMGQEVVTSQPMTWGDCHGEFYWIGLGGELGIMRPSSTEPDKLEPSNFFFQDSETQGKWHHFVYSFNFPEGTYKLTVDDNTIYTSPACTNDTFSIPAASSEIVGIRFTDGLPSGNSNHMSEADYACANIVVGDGGN